MTRKMTFIYMLIIIVGSTLANENGCKYKNNKFICKNIQIYENILQNLNNIDSNSIEEILIINSNITILKPDLFSTVRNVRKVKIINCNLEKIAKNALDDLNRLEILNLSHNKLQLITRDHFTNLINLHELILHDNFIDNIDDNALINLNKLKILSLQHNKLRKLNKQVLPASTRLIFLNVTDNEIVNVDAYTFERVPNLEYLRIKGNKIWTLTNNTFNGLLKIEQLDLSDLNIHVINDFAFNQMANLKFLNLSFNHIEFIGSATFYGLNGLITLDLRGNENISKMQFPFINFIALENLHVPKYCYRNFIEWGFFTGLRAIQFLNLSNYQLTASGEYFFEGLDSVKRLNLSHNLYREIRVNMFYPMQQLVVLDLSFNVIETIERGAYAGLNSLKTLILNNNYLKHFDFSYDNIFLNQLFLHENFLETLTPDYSNLQSLHELNIRHNNLRVFPNISLVDLEVFDLRNNQLNDLNFELLFDLNARLEYVFVQFNPWNCTRLAMFISELTGRKIIYKSADDNIHLTGNNVMGIICTDS